VVGPEGHASPFTSPLSLAEVGSLPSAKVMLSSASSVLRTPPTPATASSWISTLRLYQLLHQVWSRRPLQVSLVALNTVSTCHSHYADGFFAGVLPESSLLPWPSPYLHRLGSRLYNITTLQDSLHVTACRFAPPFAEGILRFSTSSCPEALGACYGALW
jgi:hypothetical protein